MKLRRMSAVKGKATNQEIDSVKRAKSQLGDNRALEVLMEAQNYYAGMEQYRRERERNKRYTYGEQWSDPIVYKGKVMSEEQYLISQGNLPLKNNLIRRLVRNVIGVWRDQSAEPTCVARDRDEQKLGETMSTVLQYNMQLNRMKEMYARTMEEFLIGALIVHRKWYGWRNDKNECWTDRVEPNNFFIDSNMRDMRGWDAACLGEIHDVDFQTLCKQFAHSPSDYDKLAQIYKSARDQRALSGAWEQFGYPLENNVDFLMPRDETRCRVIEVWRKEQKARYRCHDYNNGEVFKIDEEDYAELVEAENRRRTEQGLSAGMSIDEIPVIKAEWMVDDYWYYYYLTPLGDILAEGETPYAHKSHPYVVMAYPFIDGEIHSFVSDVIDQQKYVNRLITMYDWIMRASAKGVLLVPEDVIPKGMSVEDFAESWSSVNGVVVYTPSKTGAAPQQVSANSTNIGIQELLTLQLNFFEDISGVSKALQGKTSYSGESAAHFNAQTQNSTVSLADILDSFGAFQLDAAYKDVKNIQQFYDQKRVMNIAGRSSQIIYDPDTIRDVEFDLSVVPSTSTPAYRAMANELLLQLLQMGQINIKQMLEVGNFPFADELLQNIGSQEEQISNGEAPGGIDPELLKQAAEGADQESVRRLDRALRGGS